MLTAALSERTSLAKTPDWRNVDLKTLREEIIRRDRPAVIKGFVQHWPLFRASAQSPEALRDYILARDLGHPTRVMVGQPDIKGLYFYRDDLTGLNFEFAQRPFHATLTSILEYRNQSNPPAMYTGATSVAENFPQIGQENRLGLLDEHLSDRPAKAWLWLGNAVTAATHYDNLDGINCIVAGRKRFTFFPPDQFPNLYVGPLDLAPGGQPTSLVKVTAPDLERYPRFTQALAAAETVDVEPGDAVFVPSLWWHNVESLEPLNLSMNYWWFEGPKGGAEPFAALAHGLLAITPLPAGDRELWRKMFDHYVFRTDGDPAPYLPPERRGMLGPLYPALEGYMRAQLIRSLAKQLPKHLREQILHLMTPKR
jgi:Cupin-like domain